ncbi:MAG: hypothetical protein GXO86_06375 [Chlorobi bacterium]|nr:hypothetical protein [Chlorobiota bacterium]
MKIRFFRRLKRKLRFSSKSHGSRYYFQQNVIKDMADLKLTLNPLPKTKVVESDKSFLFNEIPLREITYKTLKAKRGSPAYILWNDEQIPKHRVYFYREHFGSYKFLMQYHFIEKRFVFACNRISSHNGLTNSDKEEIIRQLLTKYTGLEIKKSKSNFEVKLIDKEGNIIFTYDSVYFLVNYLPNNENTRHLIKEFGLETEIRESLSNHRENLKDLI